MKKQPQDIIAAIAADPSRLAKEAILSQAMIDDQLEFFQGLAMTYDALITFGVKEVPESTNSSGQGLSWTMFLELAQALRARKLTGHAARDAIALAMGIATADQWNGWYRRILIKDQRAGFSSTTVNKVAKELKKPEYSIPVFECQLATDAAKDPGKLTGKKIVDRKYDGTRALVFLDYAHHTVNIFSRNGKEFLNFTHIQTALEPLIDVFGRDTVLDSEIISSSFQALMKQARRKVDADASDARMIIFDILPAWEFRQGFSTMNQRNRLRFLADHKNAIAATGVAEVIESRVIDLDSLVGQIELKDFTHQVVVVEKLEGVMIKSVDAMYQCKRGHNWMKIKPVITVDLEVIAVEQGTGRNADRMGALVCRGTDQGREILTNVGSGFTDDQRTEIWETFKKSPDSVLGQLVEIAADTLTLSQDSTVYSLRFPRWISWRGFKAGQKI